MTDYYIRFGEIPDGEQSTDHTDGSSEEGVSVYPAVEKPISKDADLSNYAENPEVEYHPTGNKIQNIFQLMLRDTYLVTGEEVGRGADGEPVIRDVNVVCELGSPSGTGGWIDKTSYKGQ